MWSVPMDIAPTACGTATGLMCVGGSLGAFLSPITTGYLVDLTGTWRAAFLFTILLLAAGAVLAFFMRPDRVFTGVSRRVTAGPGGLAPDVARS